MPTSFKRADRRRERATSRRVHTRRTRSSRRARRKSRQRRNPHCIVVSCMSNFSLCSSRRTARSRNFRRLATSQRDLGPRFTILKKISENSRREVRAVPKSHSEACESSRMIRMECFLSAAFVFDRVIVAGAPGVRGDVVPPHAILLSRSRAGVRRVVND